VEEKPPPWVNTRSFLASDVSTDLGLGTGLGTLLVRGDATQRMASAPTPCWEASNPADSSPLSHAVAPASQPSSRAPRRARRDCSCRRLRRDPESSPARARGQPSQRVETGGLCGHADPVAVAGHAGKFAAFAADLPRTQRAWHSRTDCIIPLQWVRTHPLTSAVPASFVHLARKCWLCRSALEIASHVSQSSDRARCHRRLFSHALTLAL